MAILAGMHVNISYYLVALCFDGRQRRSPRRRRPHREGLDRAPALPSVGGVGHAGTARRLVLFQLLDDVFRVPI